MRKSVSKNLLVILDLEGVICHLNKTRNLVGSQGVYEQRNHRLPPIYEDSNRELFQRTQFPSFRHQMLVGKKKEFDVGVWSTAGAEDTQFMVQKLFGRYLQQLLFITYQDSMEAEREGQESQIEPQPVNRNLANIWSRYQHYNEENTLVVSNYYNQIEDFQRNDIILPRFHPKEGSTDFEDDHHMSYLGEYLSFVLSLDRIAGEDVRMRMEGFNYEQFCSRTQKQLRYDNKRHSFDDDVF